MQDVFKINGIVVAQPDEELGYSWETTYTDDSTRTQTGAFYSNVYSRVVYIPRICTDGIRNGTDHAADHVRAQLYSSCIFAAPELLARY